MEIALLSAGAFIAGLVDAVAGGGGLIQLPLLLAIFPEYPIPLLFGTNKLSSIAGTASAAVRYSIHVKLPMNIVIPGSFAALIGSALGASSVNLIPHAVLKPLVLILLILVGSYTFLKPGFGSTHTRPVITRFIPAGAAVAGFSIGFYDGFFGPGTGSFLIFIFIRLFGLDMLHSSAAAKTLNLATNLAAVIIFALSSSILWKTGLIMAAANIAGAQTGAHLAIRHGNKFIRWIMLCAVSALILKIGIGMVI
jgi:uncharacterized membrane protein YfcA